MKNLNLKKILIGAGIAFVVSAVLILLLTLLVYFGDFDDSTVSVFVLVLSIISVFVGAFVLARNIQGGGLVNGLVLGLIYCLVLMGASLFYGRVSFDFSNITRIAVILASAMLGGVLGINSQD